MTIEEFCTVLLEKNDYGSHMTLEGILHYYGQWNRKHIRGDIDEYRYHREVMDRIYAKGEMQRAEARLAATS